MYIYIYMFIYIILIIYIYIHSVLKHDCGKRMVLGVMHLAILLKLSSPFPSPKHQESRIGLSPP